VLPSNLRRSRRQNVALSYVRLDLLREALLTFGEPGRFTEPDDDIVGSGLPPRRYLLHECVDLIRVTYVALDGRPDPTIRPLLQCVGGRLERIRIGAVAVQVDRLPSVAECRCALDGGIGETADGDRDALWSGRFEKPAQVAVVPAVESGFSAGPEVSQ